MKKMLLLCSVLLLSAAAANASMVYSPNDWSDAASWSSYFDANQTTIVGTLAQSDNGYKLTDRSGATYQLSGKTNGLKNHVGNTIKVTGSTNSESAGAPTIEVNSFKRVNG